MKNPQKGFVAPLLIGIIALLVIGGGVYVYETKKIYTPVVIDNSTLQSDQIQQTNTQNYSNNNQQNPTIIRATPSSNPVSVKSPMAVSSSTASVTLNISPNTLPDAYIDPPNQRLDSTFYSQRLTATGFIKPGLKWDIVRGSLPPGILISKINIVCANQSACDSTKETYQASLTGRPQNIGAFAFTVRVANDDQSTEKTYSLSVANHSSIKD